MATKWKAIKPGKFDRDAFGFDGMAGDFRDKILGDFKSTTRTWRKEVKFEADVKASKSRVQASVTTDNVIYGYVTKGTEPHVIKPKKKKQLIFRGVYSAKTTPGVIGSQDGGSSGPFIRARAVKHPGTKGRGFEEIIRRKREPDFQELVQATLKNGAKKSGHAL